MDTTSSDKTGAAMADKAKAAAHEASQEVKAEMRGAAETVADEAGAYAERARGAAADEVRDVAGALRKAAQELRDGSPQERTFSQIADALADASDAVRDKDLGEIAGAMNDFARRNPVAFLGGAALVGFAATRFARASGRPQVSGGRPGQPPAATSRAPRAVPSPASGSHIAGEQT